MSDYAKFVVEEDGVVSAWMQSSPHGAWVKLTPIVDVLEECDCGECLGTISMDYRRVAEMVARPLFS